MSKTGRWLSERLKNVMEAAHDLAPGLKNFAPQALAELKRMGIHGSSEFSSGIITGNAYLPYGPGQMTPSVELDGHGHGLEHVYGSSPEQEQEHEREMERDR